MKDLGIKIGTKAEALWTKVKKEAEILIEQSEESLTIQKEMLKLADKKIAEEKGKVYVGFISDWSVDKVQKIYSGTVQMIDKWYE